jgi:hypothetical protein
LEQEIGLTRKGVAPVKLEVLSQSRRYAAGFARADGFGYADRLGF